MCSLLTLRITGQAAHYKKANDCVEKLHMTIRCSPDNQCVKGQKGKVLHELEDKTSRCTVFGSCVYQNIQTRIQFLDKQKNGTAKKILSS